VSTKSVVVAVFVFCISGRISLNAQNPRFDVATIKPNNSGDSASTQFSPPGGRYVARNISLKLLIRSAYRLSNYQVSGGPDWIRFDKFDIDAKSEANPSPDEIRFMVQRLLADRFQLKVHNAIKQDAVYALVTAKGGPKIKAVPDNGTGQHNVGATQGHLFTTNGQISGLVPFLTQILDRQVVDKTGLIGFFDFNFALPTNILPSPDSSESTIFEAIQDQLGLRLDLTKGPVEFLVIDSVERPSEN
jgi:uncharacterized protein (TIGR03435 family)